MSYAAFPVAPPQRPSRPACPACQQAYGAVSPGGITTIAGGLLLALALGGVVFVVMAQMDKAR